MMTNAIVIAGRANVGKSTLFNRLVEKKQALVSAGAGTTRDRTEGRCWWRGLEYRVVDTGGLELLEKAKTTIDQGIIDQALKGVADAAVILFVVDTKTGILPGDRAVAKILRQTGKPVLVVANKVDRQINHEVMADCVRLGFGPAWPVSAVNGSGVGDVMEEVLKHAKPIKNKVTEKPALRLAIVGQPNVGKSSLINTLIGEERVIVSDIAHTTREAHDIPFIYHSRPYTIVDTAGMRRNKSARTKLETMSVAQSIANAKTADVIALVIDGSQPIHQQDKHIGQLLNEQHAGVMIIINKWDLVKTEVKNPHRYTQELFAAMPHVSWAPVIFVSAKTKQRVREIITTAEAIQVNRSRPITNKQLERMLKQSIITNAPRAGKGHQQPYIYHIRQTGVNPPDFEMAVNRYGTITPQYIRFIENQLRRHFEFTGAPIHLEVLEYKKTMDKDKKEEKDDKK